MLTHCSSLQIMATYLADRVIVFEGVPSVHAKANSPESLLTGMNSFMAKLVSKGDLLPVNSE
jgi:translation initiation factor RLI1